MQSSSAIRVHNAPATNNHHYGLYSSRCKARWQHWPHVSRVAPKAWKDSHPEQLPTDIGHSSAQTIPQRACRSAWARLIAKLYEVDPLICLRCGSRMAVLTVIVDPAQIRKATCAALGIIACLGRHGRGPPLLG